MNANARFCGACGQAIAPTETSASSTATSQPTPDNMVGRTIANRYRIISRLGQGGMGAVYLAEQISLKRQVALKVLKSELSSEPGLIRRFNAEAELAAKLAHPNTVTLFDFGQSEDGSLFIAMEFITGRSLREAIVQDGAMPASRALAIMEQVAASLTDAHAHGIVHRDMKPDNVMLSELGKRTDVVKVLDFGIAKLRDERGDATVPVTQAGDLLGTPQYMAPEQIKGEAVDGRTDVYALGAMLYEMITGRLPFEAPTVMAILGKHLTEQPIPPSHKRPDLGIAPALDQLVIECLQKSPDARPPSMEAMGERLASLKTQLSAATTTHEGHPEPIGTAPTVPPGTNTPRPLRRSLSRPPGVPITVPAPGEIVPPTATPAPGPYGTPAHQPAYATPAHQGAVNQMGPAYGQIPSAELRTGPGTNVQGTAPAPMVAAKRGGSKLALWIALGVVGAALAIALAVIFTSGGSSKDDGSNEVASGDGTGDSKWGTGDDSDEDILGGPPKLPPGTGKGVGNTGDIPGELWTHPTLGYQIIVPPGYTAATNTPDRMFFQGTWGGSPAWLTVTGMPIDPSLLSDELLEQTVMALVNMTNGSIVDKRFRPVQGVRSMTAVYDVPQNNTRWQMVIYVRGNVAIVVNWGTQKGQYMSSAQLRGQLFRKRVILPGSSSSSSSGQGVY